MSPMKSGPPLGNPHLAGTLSLPQVARRWGVSCRQIRRMLGCQELEFVAICGEFRVPRKAVQRYERRHGGPGPRGSDRRAD